jgi:hypothetical protein
MRSYWEPHKEAAALLLFGPIGPAAGTITLVSIIRHK